MSSVVNFGITVLLIIASSVLATEQPLESGYFKLMLHLGQNPSDRIHLTHGYRWIDNNPKLRPAPGQIMDFSDGGGDPNNRPATNDMMIWTPQYSETGYFADEGYDNFFTQYYHIYIHSPGERLARLRFRKFDGLTVWNNGQNICDVRDSDKQQERQVDFTLWSGVNSITFKLTGPPLGSTEGCHLAVRITDRNDTEFSDLTYSLEPPLPESVTYVIRHLPEDYDSGSAIDVDLEVAATSQTYPNEIHIIEYIPQGTSIADAGGGQVIHNSLWWTVPAGEIIPEKLQYRLSVPANQTGPIPFSGYLYRDKEFMEIAGGKAVFEDPQVSPTEMADSIETIEFFPGEYSQSEGITIGGEFAEDYSGSLAPYGRGLVSGMKAYTTGGWAEYEFSVTNPGRYQILLDYGELWTMYHHSSPVNVIVDGSISLDAELFPTTHSYAWGGEVVYGPTGDPERKGLWSVGSLTLSAGQHTLRLVFPPISSPEKKLDQYTDGRPVVTRIVMTNYPDFTLPGLAEPHHLDSYEHPPAMIVSDREITKTADGCLEMTYHGTFYSLSQGNELYFADPQTWPKPGSEDSRFEILSVEPDVFHLPPEGQQDFVLKICSKEVVPDDYSELFMVWLQGVPSCPARKPYLFTTTQHYITLPPWEYSESFWMAMGYYARGIRRDITDPPEAFLPGREDLGFENGRYRRGPVQFLEDQLRAGKLPSVTQIFQQNGWDNDHPYDTWDKTWGALLGSLYHREGTGLQAKRYALRLAETNVFYPVQKRWDWSRPEYLPRFSYEMGGFQALGLAIKAGREDLMTEEEQFRILHNLVLPIFNAYWGELRVVLTLEEDAKEGDTTVHVSQFAYGDTGSPTDGLQSGSPYIKIDGDVYRTRYLGIDTIEISEPLRRDYQKGMKLVSWPYSEGIELEAMDLMSLLAIGTAGRDTALIDQVMAMYTEIMEKQKVMLSDGSFRNEPGSYGSMHPYMQTLLDAQQWLGQDFSSLISPKLVDMIHQAIINISQFPFSNGKVPHLNGGGCMNQLDRSYFKENNILADLFPDDLQNIDLYERIKQQELNRVPGDIIDNHNFMVPGWGYAMMRSENGSWDRGMETLLSSKYLMSDPGDHVSADCLGIVLYGLGAILTPRYGYSWMGFAPPFLNQVMIDSNRDENDYYGSFWHFDGRKELPCAVAHTGDGDNCSMLAHDMSRWCIQFPEYLFDAYFVQANDPNDHKYEWSLINMGDLEIVEPSHLQWHAYPDFLGDYWPEIGNRGAGERMITSDIDERIIADWHISNANWIPDDDPTLLRNEPQHGGKLRLIMADNGTSRLIDVQVGYYRQWNGEQTLANSQDILAVQKLAASHAFIDTLEPIADDEEAYVKDVVVVDRGNDNQQLVKVTTAEGQDWVYLSGKWVSRPDGDQPIAGITTDADILAWRVVGNKVTRFYLAGGSYAQTAHGSWDFGTQGNHYTTE